MKTLSLLIILLSTNLCFAQEMKITRLIEWIQDGHDFTHHTRYGKFSFHELFKKYFFETNYTFWKGEVECSLKKNELERWGKKTLQKIGPLMIKKSPYLEQELSISIYQSISKKNTRYIQWSGMLKLQPTITENRWNSQTTLFLDFDKKKNKGWMSINYQTSDF
ncbi:MAG: hypothetical protein CL678_09150 [Bdellovibrionaceae bacterium]|nr:hypothetical protein [Pseudobdellovibrionaceae bacterium]|tara:strand:- start:2725 stop:3216 length:492 start_codon:yes stop_codon:yes gene_type:complete